jgi:outer membrane protein TolC
MWAVPLLALVAFASPPLEANTSITYDEALGLAAASPAVSGARRAVEVKREGDAHVSSLPSNPLVLLQPAVAPRDAMRRPEGQLSLTVPLSLAGLGSARRDAATRETATLDAQAHAEALSRRLDAARAWIDLWSAELAEKLSREELALATELADRTRRAAESAALTRADAADADTYRAEALLLALSVEGEVTDLGLALSRAVSRGTPVVLSTAGQLPSPEVPGRDRWPSLVAAAGALPAPRALQLSAEAEKARAVEARAARGFEVALGAMAQRDATGRDLFLATVGFNLPFFERGAREAAPRAAEAVRLEGAAVDASRVAAADLARSLHEVEHSAEVLRAIETGLVPAALESVRLREAALKAGDATVLEVLVARRTAIQARSRAIRALAAFAWARVRATLLLGQLPATLATPATSTPSGGQS